jgi:hypothetical protein
LIVVAVVAALSAGLGLAVILLTGSNTPLEHEYTLAPAACVQAWNQNAPALYVGRHQFGVHRYKQVEVLGLSLDGSKELPVGSPGAYCAIVFANSSLDPEFAAAAVIKKPAAWFALSTSASPNRLAELQSDAKTAYNADLNADGSITALAPP